MTPFLCKEVDGTSYMDIDRIDSVTFPDAELALFSKEGSVNGFMNRSFSSSGPAASYETRLRPFGFHRVQIVDNAIPDLSALFSRQGRG